MQNRLGPRRSAQSRVCTFRKTQNASLVRVARGGCDSAVQHKTSRHECGSVGAGPLKFWRQDSRCPWEPITLRCALTADVTAQPGAARVDGAVCTSPNSCRGEKCRFVVVDLETVARWSEEALQFVQSLAAVRARDAPLALHQSAALAWRRRRFGCFQCHALVPSPVRGWPCPLRCMPGRSRRVGP